MPKASGDVAIQSLVLLTEEYKLFEKAMVFQLAVVTWVMRGSPVIDDGLRAALGLACYVFDMLMCGWNSLIHGFYAVALHPVRDIDQAMITEVAVTLNSGTARRFWEGELEDSEARQALQNALEQEDKEFAEKWSSDRKHLRKLLHKMVHPGRTSISPSIIIDPAGQFATPLIGGQFIEERCLRIGRLYDSLAFSAAVQATQAFKSVLPNDSALEKHFKEIVVWGKGLINRWEKEMGFS